eukprot:4172925-Pleurochrysis_carterae.AAC.1
MTRQASGESNGLIAVEIKRGPPSNMGTCAAAHVLALKHTRAAPPQAELDASRRKAQTEPMRACGLSRCVLAGYG